MGYRCIIQFIFNIMIWIRIIEGKALEKSYRAVPDGKILAWICVRKCQAYPSDNNKRGVTEVSF